MMAQHLIDELEFMLEDQFDMDEFDNDELGALQEAEADEGSDLEGDADVNKLWTDTSAYEFRNGKDMQGIPWKNLLHDRNKSREMRLWQYQNYENLNRPRDALEKELKKVETGSSFYDFHYTKRLLKLTIGHFQLRNLLCATSKHDVYMLQKHRVMHWSSLFRRRKTALDLSGKIVPTQKHHESSEPHTLSRVKISTMVVKDGLMVAGGSHGELFCKNLNRPGVDFCTRVTNYGDDITNTVDAYRTPNGALLIATANNDCSVRIFDANGFAMLNRVSYSWPVNNTSTSPDGKLLAVLGDSTDCLIADSQSGKVISILKGHLDYAFSSAWHPDGHILATGNQDTTCRLWDVRKLSESVTVVKGRMAAIRGIKFSADGRFMAMSEAADFVHVFDVAADYREAQEIDFFGEISGLCFSPDSEALFVGVADRKFGGLMEFRRRHQFQHLDSFL